MLNSNWNSLKSDSETLNEELSHWCLIPLADDLVGAVFIYIYITFILTSLHKLFRIILEPVVLKDNQ